MFRLNRLVARNSDNLKSVVKRLQAGQCATGSHVTQDSGFSSKAAPFDGVDGQSDATTTSNSNSFGLVPPAIDREISLFGPRDLRAPLPGNVGLFPELRRERVTCTQDLDSINQQSSSGDHFFVTRGQEGQDKGQRRNARPGQCDLLSAELNADRQARILDQLLYPTVYEETEEDNSFDKMPAKDILECVAHECPELLCKDFQELFPGRNLGRRTTVITVCQKSKSDMSAWSPDMELEREEMMEHFMEMASSVSQKLNEAGYWADYVDPFSGRPYLGPFTNATFFETDERYRQLGFEIEDLGCCKITRHHAWGTQAFVGSLFTNAPVESTVVRDIIGSLSDRSE